MNKQTGQGILLENMASNNCYSLLLVLRGWKGVAVGPNSIIGACSPVTNNVPPNIVIGGNPAKVICPIDVYKAKLLKMWERQKQPGYFCDFKDGKKYSAKDIENAKKRDGALLKEHLTKLFCEDDYR